MSSVSQIITFRKGRAFTTRKPEPPVVPAPPAAPAVPSAKVTIGGTPGAQALTGLTYAPKVQKPPTIVIDTRPPSPNTEPAEAQASAARQAELRKAAAEPEAAAPIAPPPPPPAPKRPDAPERSEADTPR